MKYNSKKVLKIMAILCLIFAITGSSFAHSGRTDSNGGHKDNQNKSGLGSYHYHCGGNPPHLHSNGACPYSSSSSSNSSDSVATSASTVETTEETIIEASSIEINENITKMKVGETEKLTATITPENTTDKDITWESNNEDIATVSSTGKIVALEAGKVSITVTTSNGKRDTIEIIIEEVKEENVKKDTIIVPLQNNEINNTTTNTSEDTNAISGIIGLGLIGGGIYWVYKKCC